ncbi:hypothetical protein PR048_007998 [Dryococelus australis]|uniref:Uncharacterized protein n=1 Tax=Dryococelus australis TaxID=614101 RepID=A0ABQ9HVU6_9NEOP|nr:hypothetical protein PR048_007998 [Dryococelus australis]
MCRIGQKHFLALAVKMTVVVRREIREFFAGKRGKTSSNRPFCMVKQGKGKFKMVAADYRGRRTYKRRCHNEDVKRDTLTGDASYLPKPEAHILSTRIGDKNNLPAAKHSPVKFGRRYKQRVGSFGVLRAFTAGMQGRGERETPEETRRTAASSGTIRTCENPGATPPEVKPDSHWWEASSLTATPPQTRPYGENFPNGARSHVICEPSGWPRVTTRFAICRTLLSVALKKGGFLEGEPPLHCLSGTAGLRRGRRSAAGQFKLSRQVHLPATMGDTRKYFQPTYFVLASSVTFPLCNAQRSCIQYLASSPAAFPGGTVNTKMARRVQSLIKIPEVTLNFVHEVNAFGSELDAFEDAVKSLFNELLHADPLEDLDENVFTATSTYSPATHSANYQNIRKLTTLHLNRITNLPADKSANLQSVKQFVNTLNKNAHDLKG